MHHNFKTYAPHHHLLMSRNRREACALQLQINGARPWPSSTLHATMMLLVDFIHRRISNCIILLLVVVGILLSWQSPSSPLFLLSSSSCFVRAQAPSSGEPCSNVPLIAGDVVLASANAFSFVREGCDINRHLRIVPSVAATPHNTVSIRGVTVVSAVLIIRGHLASTLPLSGPADGTGTAPIIVSISDCTLYDSVLTFTEVFPPNSQITVEETNIRMAGGLQSSAAAASALGTFGIDGSGVGLVCAAPTLVGMMAGPTLVLGANATCTFRAMAITYEAEAVEPSGVPVLGIALQHLTLFEGSNMTISDVSLELYQVVTRDCYAVVFLPPTQKGNSSSTTSASNGSNSSRVISGLVVSRSGSNVTNAAKTSGLTIARASRNLDGSPMMAAARRSASIRRGGMLSVTDCWLSVGLIATGYARHVHFMNMQHAPINCTDDGAYLAGEMPGGVALIRNDITSLYLGLSPNFLQLGPLFTGNRRRCVIDLIGNTFYPFIDTGAPVRSASFLVFHNNSIPAGMELTLLRNEFGPDAEVGDYYHRFVRAEAVNTSGPLGGFFTLGGTLMIKDTAIQLRNLEPHIPQIDFGGALLVVEPRAHLVLRDTFVRKDLPQVLPILRVGRLSGGGMIAFCHTIRIDTELALSQIPDAKVFQLVNTTAAHETDISPICPDLSSTITSSLPPIPTATATYSIRMTTSQTVTQSRTLSASSTDSQSVSVSGKQPQTLTVAVGLSGTVTQMEEEPTATEREEGTSTTTDGETTTEEETSPVTEANTFTTLEEDTSTPNEETAATSNASLDQTTTLFVEETTTREETIVTSPQSTEEDETTSAITEEETTNTNNTTTASPASASPSSDLSTAAETTTITIPTSTIEETTSPQPLTPSTQVTTLTPTTSSQAFITSTASTITANTTDASLMPTTAMSETTQAAPNVTTTNATSSTAAPAVPSFTLPPAVEGSKDTAGGIAVGIGIGSSATSGSVAIGLAIIRMAQCGRDSEMLEARRVATATRPAAAKGGESATTTHGNTSSAPTSNHDATTSAAVIDDGGDGSGSGDGMSESDDAIEVVEVEAAVPFVCHPLQFGLGSPPYNIARGAVVSNLVIIPIVFGVIVRYAIAPIIGKWFIPAGEKALLILGWPSALIVPFSILSEGTAFASVMLLSSAIDGDDEAHRGANVAVGLIGLGTCVATMVLWAIVLGCIVPRNLLVLRHPLGSASSARRRRQRGRKGIRGASVLSHADDDNGDDACSGMRISNRYADRRHTSVLQRAIRPFRDWVLIEPRTSQTKARTTEGEGVLGNDALLPEGVPLQFQEEEDEANYVGNHSAYVQTSAEGRDNSFYDEANSYHHQAHYDGGGGGGTEEDGRVDAEKVSFSEFYDGGGGFVGPVAAAAERISDLGERGGISLSFFDENDLRDVFGGGEAQEGGSAHRATPRTEFTPPTAVANAMSGGEADRNDDGGDDNDAMKHVPTTAIVEREKINKLIMAGHKERMRMLAHFVGEERWWLWADMAGAACALTVGIAEGIPDAYCKHRILLALAATVVQCAVSFLSLVAAEVVAQGLLSVINVVLVVIAAVRIFHDQDDGMSSLLDIVSVFSNIVGIIAIIISVCRNLILLRSHVRKTRYDAKALSRRVFGDPDGDLVVDDDDDDDGNNVPLIPLPPTGGSNDDDDFDLIELDETNPEGTRYNDMRYNCPDVKHDHDNEKNKRLRFLKGVAESAAERARGGLDVSRKHRKKGKHFDIALGRHLLTEAEQRELTARALVVEDDLNLQLEEDEDEGLGGGDEEVEVEGALDGIEQHHAEEEGCI